MLNVAGDNASQSARAFVRRVVDDFPTARGGVQARARVRGSDGQELTTLCVPIKTSTFLNISVRNQPIFLQLLVHICGKHTNKLTISAIFTYLKFHLAYDVTIDYLRCIQFLRKAAEIRSDAQDLPFTRYSGNIF